MTTIRYYIRCASNLIRYGNKSEYVSRYGYAKTLADIAKVQVRSHWLIG